MVTRICWTCRTASHMTQYAPAYKIETDEQNVRIVACKCDNCNAPNIAVTEPLVPEYDYSFSAPDFIEAGGIRIIQWYPDFPYGKEYKNVPEAISSAASEAYSCFSIRSYRACILMARSALEAICKQHHIEKGSLANKIEKLSQETNMSSLVTEQANEIRYFGNEMAHGDFTQPVDEDDAKDILDLMDIIIDYVYQQPEQLAALKERRLQRKEHNEET
ncbi:DUF4145 domain-containing protein [Alloscardovia theropitheci]|uniref:DUF4145 domain-containing protein n=1 Tax=Alloscardovia theropitheci TaxID=2496842 RepID=A0A4R0QSJ8_9BIFI|nr:DUF4145 domain-containing protein [Alloscardovia theropitheci]TCD54418.1 DUF4145 domain-containing protein [Alloscardovia theropitheci]